MSCSYGFGTDFGFLSYLRHTYWSALNVIRFPSTDFLIIRLQTKLYRILKSNGMNFLCNYIAYLKFNTNSLHGLFVNKWPGMFRL